MSQIPNLISYSECLLEKGIGYAGEAIGRWQIRNCKEKCANLKKKMGAPFWSWNSKNKRCHLKVTNTDQKLSVGCGRETPMPLVLIHQAAHVSQSQNI